MLPRPGVTKKVAAATFFVNSVAGRTAVLTKY